MFTIQISPTIISRHISKKRHQKFLKKKLNRKKVNIPVEVEQKI